MKVNEQFGHIDIYLFDQLQKGRIEPGMRLLDAGCGEGRNLIYFLRESYDVFAVDRSEEAVQAVRRHAVKLADFALQGNERFRVEPVEKMSFANDSFDVVISCAVLHFADHESHFQQMVSELWRVLKPGGLLFVRTASGIGMEEQVRPLGSGRYGLPDGSERFLVTEDMLLRCTEKLHGQLLEPIKTVLVPNQRSMTTWCVKKPHILFFDPIEEMPDETGQGKEEGSL
ncbi:class I SAM-dependent methyltransferase [Paenibacillus cremeus]|uniref:Class I SAM-dependent methyltransferase n=1 Tax=Paenibacillus cremeus TaxID=2163881 RepID=A0A559KD59_9BACL|nr:class I SAM-dependent methyltransferase [Paenibacillus cremeus]TVY10071.1 class I SAM-dependent methyltransferase [Paenibacillus cremeus]